jgi:replicative DNA helicase
VQSRPSSTTASTRNGRRVKYSEFIRRRFKELKKQKAAKDRGEDPRVTIPTGLKELDRLGGTKRGILTLVGAATGQGKDIYMLNLMTAAAKQGYTVEVISMEDPPERTVDRTFSTLTGINNAKLYSVDVDDKAMANVALAASEAEEWADNIEFHEGLKEADDAVEILTNSEADLRIINYLQCFPGELERTIAEVCWKLNKAAQDDNCAMVAFSQVNTAKVEERGLRMMEASLRRDPERPIIEGFRPYGPSDLAWCQAAGQRAKDLRFLFRPGQYLRRAGVNAKDDRLEISGTKNSFGSEGRVVVGFDGKTARLFDMPE